MAPLYKGSCPASGRTEGLLRVRGKGKGKALPQSPHRTSSLSCSGVSVGLFSEKAIWLFLQNARPPGSLRSPSDAAPNQLFELLRCSGRLIGYLRAIPPFGALAFRSAYWLSSRHPALRRAGVPFGLLAAPNARTPVASRPTASPNARTPVASRPTASSNARLSGSLRSPSVYAPKCSFGTFRCSAWLIGIREHTVLSDPKRSCSRFAARTLRCCTEPAFQAVPVFRMAYFPYLTAFRMQAKQIQRLPLRGAGAKRLKGGPLGIGARGRGPQAPSPICTRPAAAQQNCTHQDRVSPPRKVSGNPQVS